MIQARGPEILYTAPEYRRGAHRWPIIAREQIIAALTTFAETPKFRCQEPQFNYLNPSPRAITQPLEAALNQCAINLRLQVQRDGGSGEFRRCISKSLRSVQKPFDTEDREYLLFYYDQLAQIVGIRIGLLLNSWLYGFPLALLLQLFGRR